MKKTLEEIKKELDKPIYREFNLVREDLDEDKREIPLAFSSELPYERYFGMEIINKIAGLKETTDGSFRAELTGRGSRSTQISAPVAPIRSASKRE